MVPTDLPEAGLCASCRYAERVVSGRGSVYLRCGRSRTDSRYAKYPPLPVRACPGYEKRDPLSDRGTGSGT